MVGVLPLDGGQAVQEEHRPVADRHFCGEVLEEVDGGALIEILLGVLQQSSIRSNNEHSSFNLIFFIIFRKESQTGIPKVLNNGLGFLRI